MPHTRWRSAHTDAMALGGGTSRWPEYLAWTVAGLAAATGARRARGRPGGRRRDQLEGRPAAGAVGSAGGHARGRAVRATRSAGSSWRWPRSSPGPRWPRCGRVSPDPGARLGGLVRRPVRRPARPVHRARAAAAARRSPPVSRLAAAGRVPDLGPGPPGARLGVRAWTGRRARLRLAGRRSTPRRTRSGCCLRAWAGTLSDLGVAPAAAAARWSCLRWWSGWCAPIRRSAPG